MNLRKVGALHCWPMWRTPGVIWAAATDQREARECKEEREKGRQALPLWRVECVSHWGSQYLHRTATPLYCMLDIQGMWCKILASSPGHSQILSRSGGEKSPLQDKIWVWPGDKASKYSNHCAKDLCIWEEDECCQDRSWVVAKQIYKSVREMANTNHEY